MRQPVMRWAAASFRTLVRVASTVAIAALVVLAAISLSRLTPVKDRWLRADRFENPLVRPIAGRRFIGRVYFGFQLGLLTHVGRRSGRTYQTPLGAYRLGDGFVFALFYGPDVDWARNVRAAGRCTLTWMGHAYSLERAEILSASEVLAKLPPWPRLVLMAAGTKEFLWLHRRDDVRGNTVAH